MTLRTDHIIGAAAVAVGALVLAIGGDLPVGSLSFPGAGMWPKLLALFMIGFGIALILGARDGEAFAAVPWHDAGHAVPVLALAALAVALYTTLGFVISMGLLLFALIAIKGRPLLHAALFGAGVSVATYTLFTAVLKIPLPRGLLEF